MSPRGTMTEANDPWSGINPPDETANLSAKRIDGRLRWDYFWAVDTKGNCLMLIQHGKEHQPQGRLPKLNGLQVEVLAGGDSPRAHLAIRLEDRAQRSLFHRFCRNLVEAGERAATEPEVVAAVLKHIWRWHRFLKKGEDKRLSAEEQKGLIGELGVLRRHLAPVVGAWGAVNAWTGPLGHPKDFEIGGVCVEAKAWRGGTRVVIASESQLEVGEAERLFLHVTELSVASEGVPGAVTVTTMAEKVRDEIGKQDASAVDLLETRLAGAGFDWKTDYTDRHWLVGSEHLFRVGDGFPRIVPAMLRPGVDRVRYSIALVHCEPFRADFGELTELIGRRGRGTGD